jgi:dTDP-4-amino-4,6-dideoxygalactose transaminase
MKNKIPFFKFEKKKSTIANIKKVINSGWLTTGDQSRIFEKKFQNFLKVKYALSVNSCTSALHLSMIANGIKKNDKVVVPSITFVSCIETILYLGAIPIVIDVNTDTNTVDFENLKLLIKKEKNIKALIFVHLSGYPIKLDDKKQNFQKICDNNNIKIIEDCSHAFPTKIFEKYIGNSNNLCCFSFYANKTLSTAEGGMITTNNKKLSDKINRIRNHGFDRDAWKRYTNIKSKWEYDVIDMGFKYNLPDLNSSLGISQLPFVLIDQKKRENIANIYYKNLSSFNYIILPKRPISNSIHSWHLFRIQLKKNIKTSRQKILAELAHLGIGTSVHYKPLHRLTYYKKKLGLLNKNYPNSENIWKSTISLPIYPSLKSRDVIYICKNLKKVINENI